MDQVLSDARNGDVGVIKQDEMKYLIPMHRIEPSNLRELRNKTEHGFYTPVTSWMLVPYQHLPDFDSDPDE